MSCAKPNRDITEFMFIGEKYPRESLVPKFPGKFIQSPITLAQKGKK